MAIENKKEADSMSKKGAKALEDFRGGSIFLRQARVFNFWIILYRGFDVYIVDTTSFR